MNAYDLTVPFIYPWPYNNAIEYEQKDIGVIGDDGVPEGCESRQLGKGYALVQLKNGEWFEGDLDEWSEFRKRRPDLIL